LRQAGPGIYRAALHLGRWATRHWSNPVRRLRKQEGLRRRCDPVFVDKFSQDLVLALFSRWFAPKQADWPPQTSQPGFVHFAPPPESEAWSQRFLSSGPAPLVFTQGSAAVHNPRDFYHVSAEIAERLRMPALLVGVKTAEGESADVLTLPYIPYSHVFPHASV